MTARIVRTAEQAAVRRVKVERVAEDRRKAVEAAIRAAERLARRSEPPAPKAPSATERDATWERDILTLHPTPAYRGTVHGQCVTVKRRRPGTFRPLIRDGLPVLSIKGDPVWYRPPGAVEEWTLYRWDARAYPGPVWPPLPGRWVTDVHPQGGARTAPTDTETRTRLVRDPDRSAGWSPYRDSLAR